MSDSRANPFGNLDRFKPKPIEAEPGDDQGPMEDQETLLKTVAGRRALRIPEQETPPKRKRRGRRSGRTRAFTTKTTPDYHALIYQIADGEIDGRERLVGEVIEQAIDALMREIAPERAGKGS